MKQQTKKFILFLIELELNIWKTEKQFGTIGLDATEVFSKIVHTKQGNSEELIAEIIGVNEDIVFHAIYDNQDKSPELILETILHNKRFYNF